MGWFAYISDCKFSITPEIKKEDRKTIINKLMRTCDIYTEDNIVDDYCRNNVSQECLEFYDKYINRLSKTDNIVKSLWGWILKDWSTLIFSYECTKYGDIKLEQLVEIVRILKKKGYTINGDLHYVCEEEYGYYLKIYNNKIHELIMHISKDSLSKITNAKIFGSNPDDSFGYRTIPLKKKTDAITYEKLKY